MPDPDKLDSAVVHIQRSSMASQPTQSSAFIYFNSANLPQPMRGGKRHRVSVLVRLALRAGHTVTDACEKINPDLYAPSGTDAGAVPGLMWPLGLSHNRFGTSPGAGWARQQNTDVLAAKSMAGVDRRLGPHVYSELHWHTAGEWALILKGCVRVGAINDKGQSFVDGICAGDVWSFPPGIPHSIPAFDEGSKFLLVFDQGNFSEDGTFLLSEIFMRNAISVLSKNLHADISAFRDIPSGELYVS